jgi:hypothetical protein
MCVLPPKHTTLSVKARDALGKSSFQEANLRVWRVTIHRSLRIVSGCSFVLKVVVYKRRDYGVTRT